MSKVMGHKMKVQAVSNLIICIYTGVSFAESGSRSGSNEFDVVSGP